MDFYTLQIIKPVIETAPQQVGWLTVLTGLSTPILAAFGIWIAANQWRTARNKLKLDLFEKRIVVYDAAREAINQLMNGAEPTLELQFKYLDGIAGARWLFDEDMGKYLNVEILGMVNRMREAFAKQDTPFDLDESRAGLQDRMALMEEFRSHWDKIDSRFASFLKVGH